MNNPNKTSSAIATYHIDPTHSTVIFKVIYMMINQSVGRFNDFNGEIAFNPHHLNDSSIWISIQIASIDTYNTDRDEHLKGVDFFEIVKHPTIAFNSTTISKQLERYMISGNLSMKGVSKHISFPAHIQGPIKSSHGQEVIGIIAEMTINRKDFGISFDKTVDDGKKPMVADQVKIDINIEASK